MKRIWIILLCLFLLACVPTPETEFVVNKGDGVIEQRLAETAEQAAKLFPDTWTEKGYDVNDRLSVEIDAEIVQKPDGVFPVYRTQERRFTDVDAQELARMLLPNPVSVHTAELTKDDWKRMFQDFLNEVETFRAWEASGRPDDGVDRDASGYPQAFVDSESAWYMEQIQSAPDSLPETPVSDYAGLGLGDSKVFRLSDGRMAHIGAFDWTLVISMDCVAQGYVYDADRYEHDIQYDDAELSSAFLPVSMDRADADAKLQHILETVGMTDFAVRIARKANLIEDAGGKAHAVATGWAYELVRDYGGYSLSRIEFEPDQNIAYGSEDGFSANRFIGKETLTVMVDADGLQYFEYTYPKTVVGVENPNAVLLPWEDARMRIQNAIEVTAPMQKYIEQDYVCKLRVYRLLLTTYTVRVRDSEDYYEMPCWVVFYDKDLRSREAISFYDDIYTPEYWERNRNDTHLTQNALIVNAIDGSIIYTDYSSQ